MPSRTKEGQIVAYNIIITLLKQRSFSPKLATRDNETSDLLLQSLKSANISINLVAPHVHRRNAAERASQIFKVHYVAILCGADPKPPFNLWDKFLPQVETP